MSILRWLGFKGTTDAPTAEAPAAGAGAPVLPVDGHVERIAEAMDALPEDEARYLAAFAYLLCRVAYADGVISKVEVQRMSRILQDFSSLTAKQTDLVLKLAKHENFKADDEVGRKVSEAFAEMAGMGARSDFVGCLYAVAAADDEVHGIEDETVMRIGEELGVAGPEVQRIRAAYARFIQL